MKAKAPKSSFAGIAPWAAVLTVMIGSLVTCQSPSVEPRNQSIHYLLTWDLRGIHLGSGETTFRWTADSGFELEIEEFYLSGFTVQLLPCADPEVNTAKASANVPSLFGVGVAQAGHGDVLGPAAIRQPMAEFVDWSPLSPDPIEAPADQFCRLHYLVARQPTPDRLPAKLDRQTSLYVRGLVTDLESAQPVAFEVHSKLAHGVFVDLSPPVGADPGSEIDPTPSIQVTVQRSLAGTFAGLKPEDFRSSRVDRQLLRNLMNTTTVHAVQHEK